MTFQEALGLFQQGELRQAEQLCRDIIARAHNHADAIHLLGVIECQKKNPAAGIELIKRAITLNPGNALAHSSLGNALEAIGRHQDALASYDRALAIDPDFTQAYFNRGNVLATLQRFEDALASYDRALAVAPEFPQALFNRANLRGHLRRDAQALADYDRVLALMPDFVPALVNRGAMLQRLNRNDEALASYGHALALQPGDVDALNNRGDVLGQMRRHGEALTCFDRALALDPRYQPSLYNRCAALRDLGRYDEAAGAGEKLLALNPGHAFLKGELLHIYMLACDWSRLTLLSESVENDLHAGKKSAEPFGYQAIANSARDLRRCAEIYTAEKYPPQTPLWVGERYTNAKIRIGYLSGEFRQHPTGVLMTELFERHDRNRFELFAFDNGWDDGSEIRGRINRAFDEIVDISHLSDQQAAAAIKQRQIDILVNLNGYFGQLRQGVFSYRPCPVQVNYLGFSGTIGADTIDYILADRWVIPPELQVHYTEKVVYLPDVYQVNDSTRAISDRLPARSEAGLPQDGFVYCCFNNHFKITPAVFDVWMRLLNKTDNAVLWLGKGNAVSQQNLRREAEKRGVPANRLVFADRTEKLADHLARHRLANLFLDTLPFNAGTTASDALWAGLPVLTCTGEAYVGRMAGSLLHAVGLPELITHNLADYEALALKLAATPHLLADLKARLASNRLTHPLFDTERFCRHIESAFTTMQQRCQNGERPAAFTVPHQPALR